MKKRTRARLVWLCLLCALLLTACQPMPPVETPPAVPTAMPIATPTSGESRYVVGVAWQGMTPYVQRLEAQLLGFAKQLPFDIEFIMMDGSENYEKQISQVENFISHKVDLILLNPCSYEKLTPAVTAANNAGIPIITMITRVQNQRECLSFVGSDHKESAILEGTLAAESLQGQGSIVILEGTIGIEAQLERRKGYAEILALYPGLSVAAIQPAFWEKDEGYMIVENLIHNGIAIDAVLSQNDNMALGALEAVEAAEMQERILVFGIDGDSAAIEAVEQGRLAGTVYMDAYHQAKQISECIQMVRDGQTPEKEYFIPFVVLNKDTIHQSSVQELLVR